MADFYRRIKNALIITLAVPFALALILMQLLPDRLFVAVCRLTDSIDGEWRRDRFSLKNRMSGATQSAQRSRWFPGRIAAIVQEDSDWLP